MNTHRRSLAGKGAMLLALGAVAVCAVLWLRRDAGRQPATAESPARKTTNTAVRRTETARTATNYPSRLWSVVDALRSGNGPAPSRKQFDELRQYLASLPKDAASTAIRDFLDSKVDVPSGVDFKIGPNGFLTDPSSLRVFLLDQLGQIDPLAAAAYAEKILREKNSTDEWAVSLRNYALGKPSPEGRSFLEQKVREMIRHEPWQQNPSIGFLEAFDVSVYIGGTGLMPDLAELLRQKDNRAMSHAAYLALDRLTIREPAVVLDRLQSEPELMEGREVTRANYFARANVEDTQQKGILESYLLDAHRSASELQTFAGLFPSGNFSISYNLLTRVTTPTGETLARQDREALRVVEGWIGDTRFERLKPHLEEIRKRLEGFVGKPKAGE